MVLSLPRHLQVHGRHLWAVATGWRDARGWRAEFWGYFKPRLCRACAKEQSGGIRAANSVRARNREGKGLQGSSADRRSIHSVPVVVFIQASASGISGLGTIVTPHRRVSSGLIVIFIRGSVRSWIAACCFYCSARMRCCLVVVLANLLLFCLYKGMTRAMFFKLLILMDNIFIGRDFTRRSREACYLG